MIICINYRDDGKRYIARIEYVLGLQAMLTITARMYTESYDEVYILPFEPTQELIDAIVLEGCRI